MAIFRALSTKVMQSGIAEDASVNTWHFQGTFDATVGAAVTAAWQQFMRDVHGGVPPNPVAQTGHTLRIYNIADPEPRAPIWDVGWSFSAAPSGTPLPAETCITISYQGARVSGEDQARRRGRMYIGPLSTGAMTDGRPGSATIAGMVTAFQTFHAALTTAGVTFGVYSRTNSALVPVTDGWIDNAFDTQRRRGVSPTSRNPFDV